MTSALKRTFLVATLVLGFIIVTNAEVIGQNQKDKTKAPPQAAATATFEVYKDAGGDFRFRLRDGDGTIIATAPKGYPAKADCLKVIDTIKQGAAKAKVEEQADKAKGKGSS